ncbi:hypothetical protein EAH89_17220 [Roseomonas nepalensis]|uniref:HK97 gp10 family phage protein n=2 Tax=Muricoccus nepalensis TaxID=1854500 RepID=A0A502FUS5_9PROT|nr:hypothetical protein EAH89_17220 [Roseomonas nepalensis]
MLGDAVKQLPFVTALALTTVVKRAQLAEQAALPSVFDKPTPFTARGIAVQPATKAEPTAAVFVRPIQAGYLAIEETGGVRKPAKRAIVMPVGAAKNVYGNLPRNALSRMKGRKDVLVGQIGGVGGIWQRPARPKGRQGARVAPKLLIGFEDQTKYEPRFGFRARAVQVIKANLAPAFREAVTKALATARR